MKRIIIFLLLMNVSAPAFGQEGFLKGFIFSRVFGGGGSSSRSNRSGFNVYGSAADVFASHLGGSGSGGHIVIAYPPMMMSGGYGQQQQQQQEHQQAYQQPYQQAYQPQQQPQDAYAQYLWSYQQYVQAYYTQRN